MCLKKSQKKKKDMGKGFWDESIFFPLNLLCFFLRPFNIYLEI